MNIEEYKENYPIYAAYAKAVKCELETAFECENNIPKPQAIQSRVKGVSSLKAKLKKQDILNTETIETEIKDLVGVRIIFYTYTDADNFLNSRFIHKCFDVEPENIKTHHPNPENNHEPYQGIHYVVKSSMLGQSNYSRFTDMRCEIQIQTVLSHLWAETSHDITYKRPKESMNSFGHDAFDEIEKQLQEFCKQYFTIAAERKLAKVSSDFKQLMQEKVLFDSNPLETLMRSCDNNERHEIIRTIKEYCVPYCSQRDAIYPNLARALCDAVCAARQTAPKQIPYSFDGLSGYRDGHTADQITIFVIDILRAFRYVDIDATIRSLAQIFCDETNNNVRQHILQASKALAEYDIGIWQKEGPRVQLLLLEFAEQLSAADRIALRPIICIIWCESLNIEVINPSLDSERSEIVSSIVVLDIFEKLKMIRQKAIDGLLSLFDQITSFSEKREILSNLMYATSISGNSCPSNDYLALTIANAEYIVNRLEEHFTDPPYDFLLCIEREILQIYQLYEKPIATMSDEPLACKDGAKSLMRAIEALRDRINADVFFVRYKTLAGFFALPPEWEGNDFDHDIAKSYRQTQFDEYVAEISEENANEWFDFVSKCASAELRVLSFPEFLYKLAKKKPLIIFGWLINADAQLLAFLPAILNGLSDSGATTDYESLITYYIEEGKYLTAIVNHLRHLQTSSLKQAKALFIKASSYNAGPAMLEFIAFALEKHECEPDWIGAIFIPALQHLTAAKDHRWVFQVGIASNLETFVVNLSSDQIRTALDGLLLVPKIDDYCIECFLAQVATRHPEAVWTFFGQRLAHEHEIKHYEAFPSSFDKLKQPLAAHAGLAIDTVRGWYRPDDPSFKRKGGRLLCAALPVFTDEVAKKFTHIAETGSEQDIDFVLNALPNYHGNPAIFPVLMTVVNRLPPNDSRFENVMYCIINTTGVAYTIQSRIESLQARKKALQHWANDARHNVKTFAIQCVKRLDSCIAEEQRRFDFYY